VEDDPLGPLNVYGASKLAGEQAIAAAGIPHLIFRTSWVYGMRGKNFLLTMLRLAKERDELRVVADQHGAPTWSRTIADTTAQVLSQAHAGGREWWVQNSGVYHLSAQGRPPGTNSPRPSSRKPGCRAKCCRLPRPNTRRRRGVRSTP
jgi:dTDP-4-dehydrorhamnose reductase